jgi:chromosome partitioning protein
MTAFYRAILEGAKTMDAELVLIDAGPNLGAINRSVLIASEFAVVPLGSDLLSLQGLQTLGYQLHAWREAWAELKERVPDPDLAIMPLAIAARKPMFFLRPADGAIGAHVEAVRDCAADYEGLAVAISKSTNWGHGESARGI